MYDFHEMYDYNHKHGLKKIEIYLPVFFIYLLNLYKQPKIKI